MTVFLDGSEVFCVDVLIRIFVQGVLQCRLRVPGLGPRLQVLLYGLGDPLVMRRHNLGSVVPVHLLEADGKDVLHPPKHQNIMTIDIKQFHVATNLVAVVLFRVVGGCDHDSSAESQMRNCERLQGRRCTIIRGELSLAE